MIASKFYNNFTSFPVYEVSHMTETPLSTGLSGKWTRTVSLSRQRSADTSAGGNKAAAAHELDALDARICTEKCG